MFIRLYGKKIASLTLNQVEVVIDPGKPKPLSLADRVGPVNKPAPQPKKDSQKPKPAGGQKNNNIRGDKKGGRRGGKAGGAARKPKTAEELDAEMVDYFEGNAAQPAAAAAAPAQAPAATADANMDEEVLVSTP